MEITKALVGVEVDKLMAQIMVKLEATCSPTEALQGGNGVESVVLLYGQDQKLRGTASAKHKKPCPENEADGEDMDNEVLAQRNVRDASDGIGFSVGLWNRIQIDAFTARRRWQRSVK